MYTYIADQGRLVRLSVAPTERWVASALPALLLSPCPASTLAGLVTRVRAPHRAVTHPQLPPPPVLGALQASLPSKWQRIWVRGTRLELRAAPAARLGLRPFVTYLSMSCDVRQSTDPVPVRLLVAPDPPLPPWHPAVAAGTGHPVPHENQVLLAPDGSLLARNAALGGSGGTLDRPFFLYHVDAVSDPSTAAVYDDTAWGPQQAVRPFTRQGLGAAGARDGAAASGSHADPIGDLRRHLQAADDLRAGTLELTKRATQLMSEARMAGQSVEVAASNLTGAAAKLDRDAGTRRRYLASLADHETETLAAVDTVLPVLADLPVLAGVVPEVGIQHPQPPQQDARAEQLPRSQRMDTADLCPSEEGPGLTLAVLRQRYLQKRDEMSAELAEYERQTARFVEQAQQRDREQVDNDLSQLESDIQARGAAQCSQCDAIQAECQRVIPGSRVAGQQSDNSESGVAMQYVNSHCDLSPRLMAEHERLLALVRKLAIRKLEVVRRSVMLVHNVMDLQRSMSSCQRTFSKHREFRRRPPGGPLGACVPARSNRMADWTTHDVLRPRLRQTPLWACPWSTSANPALFVPHLAMCHSQSFPLPLQAFATS